MANGKFYGLTYQGGANLAGVIFKWDPVTNTYTNKADFMGPIGKNPYGAMTLIGSKFYGMTSQGGANNVGVIFEWDTLTNIYSKVFDLSLALGSIPYGNLLAFDISIISVKENVLADKPINIYPNPANSILTVEITNGVFTKNDLKITTILGQEMQVKIDNVNASKATLDISGLSPGLYMLHYGTDNKMVKFVKEY